VIFSGQRNPEFCARGECSAAAGMLEALSHYPADGSFAAPPGHRSLGVVGPMPPEELQ